MPLSQSQKSLIEKARNVGGSDMAGQSHMDLRLLAPADAPDHVEQDVVVALGAGELAPDGPLVGIHPGDVQRQPADDAEAGGAVALAVARLVFVHRHVEHPVQARCEASAFSMVQWERTMRPKRSAEGLPLSRK